MRCRVLSVVAFCLACPALPAQQPSPTDGAAPYTLHVYTNLIQVPTLILDQELKPVPSLDKSSFDVRLDYGPVFHPTGLRREGDDPISLAFLLDTSGDSDELIKATAESFANLAQTSLRSTDHISIFALDCKLIRSSKDLSGAPDVLQKGLTAALQAANLHNNKSKGACGTSLMLRNAIAQTAQALGESPGRRILIAITDGHDSGSSVNWSVLQTYIAGKGIAVFGLRDAFYDRPRPEFSGFSDVRSNVPPETIGLDQEFFRGLCDNSGGFLRATTRSELPKELNQIITDIRERYIVEFPRPDNPQPGTHDIQIRISGKNNFLIRASGVSVSLPDPAEAAGATTIPVSKSPATYGTSKPLKPGK